MCHGAWKQLDKRTFAYTAFELMSDLSGNLVGYLKFRGTYTLSPSGNEYTGTTFADILDTDGNILSSVDVMNSGERIESRASLSASSLEPVHDEQVAEPPHVGVTVPTARPV